MSSSILFLLSVTVIFGFLLFKTRIRWLLTAFSITVSLLILELGSIVYERLDKTYAYSYQASSSYRESDPELRYWFNPRAQVTESKSYSDGEVVYENITYSFDEIGRRVTDPMNKSSEKHALFFGGSFTFGMGVENAQTLPSVFARCTSNNFQSYNFGAGGFGTGAMWIQLNREKFYSSIPQKKGIAVYAFLPRHLARSTGHDLFSFNRAFKNNPVFLRKEDGSIEGPLKYTEHAQLAAALRKYNWISNQSALLRQIFRIFKPTYKTEAEATKIIARLIIMSSEVYHQRFDGEFYVLIWPRVDSEMDPANLKSLETILLKNGIKVLKPTTLRNRKEAQIHARDSHPSWKEYEFIGNQLCELIDSE